MFSETDIATMARFQAEAEDFFGRVERELIPLLRRLDFEPATATANEIEDQILYGYTPNDAPATSAFTYRLPDLIYSRGDMGAWFYKNLGPDRQKAVEEIWDSANSAAEIAAYLAHAEKVETAAVG
jgi:hypothetical protein